MKSNESSLIRLTRWTATLALAWAMGVVPAVSQALRPSFEPMAVWNLSVDGQKSDAAEVYYSRAAGAFLVLAPEFEEPVLLSARTREVASLQALKVAPQGDGTYQLLSNAIDKVYGTFQIQDASTVRFAAEGKTGVLTKRAWLTGPQTASHIRAMNVQYDRDARAYKPDPDAVARLKAEPDPVRVVIYFGEWCPHCAKIVPTVLSLQEALGDSKIQFSYYGLPTTMSDDPITGKLELRGVPTALVYRAGKVIGRIYGTPWEHPGQALLSVLHEG